jgi:hypothetical protein
LPLHGKELLLLIVAFFTAGNDIALGAFTASGDGYDVIHGEFFGWNRTTAVMAEAFVTFSFPPLGVAHLPRLAALPLDIAFRKIVGKWVHFKSA